MSACDSVALTLCRRAARTFALVLRFFYSSWFRAWSFFGAVRFSAVLLQPGPFRCRSLAAALAFGGAFAALLCGAGCQELVAQAPFRLRPDTTHWGKLQGPFDGHVLDQASGSPIAAALVIGTWAFESPSGLAVPSGTYVSTALTDNNGGYSLPALPRLQGRSGLLRRFTLIVYKAGYLGYRSDLRWDDRTPRTDFAQLANKIRLERFPSGESHAHHLAFLGGGQALLRTAQAEAIQAALDLAERSPDLPSDLPAGKSAIEAELTAPVQAPPMLAAQLLSLADVKSAVRSGRADYDLEALKSNLPGEAPLGEYSGVHYQAKGLSESHDAALRVYRCGSGAEADSVWKRLLAKLSSPQLRDAGGTSVVIALPTTRAANPLFFEVPAQNPPLRDLEGKALALPARSPIAKAAQTPPQPLHLDASRTAYDSQQKAYAAAVLIRQLGLVLELVCGADLCPGEESTIGLLSHALSRL